MQIFESDEKRYEYEWGSLAEEVVHKVIIKKEDVIRKHEEKKAQEMIMDTSTTKKIV